MEVIRDINTWQSEAVVATIGFFDGVHAGHRFLLEQMRRVASVRNLPTAVITFPVHPRLILQSDYQPKLLNSFEEKLNLLAPTGVDFVIVMDFTPGLAALTAREFISDVLAKQWRVRTLLIGYDHRFGQRRSEGFEQYVAHGRMCGMEVLSAGSCAEDGVAISSSGIRKLLQVGNVAGAARLLGYFYRLKGHVTEGNRVGRAIGFPTANIAVDEGCKMIPAAGSYAVWATVGGKRFVGMLYIGSRPTLRDGGGVSVEVNIFDFSEDIYGESVTVEFVDFVRQEMRFDSLDELKGQMREDKLKVQAMMVEDPWMRMIGLGE
jgi:riboflavin kinase/FMN adenylyltransferase